MTENRITENCNLKETLELPAIYEPPIELTPEYLNTLSKENRKVLRDDLYTLNDNEINVNQYENLKQYKLFNLDIDLNYNNGHRKHVYQGAIKLNHESFEELNYSIEDKEKLERILNPKDVTDYTEAESLFNGNPQLLLTSMTLLTNNYSWVVEETDERHTYNIDGDKVDRYKPKFLFTEEEDSLFIAGRTLLKKLNEDLDSTYIENLINDADGIITRFNDGLIGKYVSKFSFLTDTDELFQVGNLGIMKALEDFDIDKGRKFSTYAYWWIRRKIQIFARVKAPLIGLPYYVNKSVGDYKKVGNSLYKINGERPSFNQVIKECKKRGIELIDNKEYLKKALNVQGIQSLDKELEESEDDTNLYKYIFEDKDNTKLERDEFLNKDQAWSLIEMAGLSEEEFKILILRYPISNNGDNYYDRGLYYKEINKKLGISQKRIKKLEDSALEKLINTAKENSNHN